MLGQRCRGQAGREGPEERDLGTLQTGGVWEEWEGFEVSPGSQPLSPQRPLGSRWRSALRRVGWVGRQTEP